jgi:hypothetical protein
MALALPMMMHGDGGPDENLHWACGPVKGHTVDHISY